MAAVLPEQQFVDLDQLVGGEPATADLPVGWPSQ
jgi:hypothetical protein